MHSQLAPLSTLPHDNRMYHVDSVGYLQPNPSCVFNPLLNIHLSPVVCDKYSEATYIAAKEFDQRRQKTYQISAGEMYAFHPGCILKNGRLEFIPQNENFSAEVNINCSTTSTIFGSKMDIHPIVGASKYLVPNSQWGFGTLGMSELIAIERNGDPYSILISALELLRFYHCCSSRLNQSILSGRIKHLDHYINTDKSKSHLDTNTRTLYLTLEKKIPREDAIIIGRWFCDKTAYNAAIKPWNQRVMMANNPNSSYFPLGSPFPFEGKTTLSGIGIPLPTPQHVKTPRTLILSLLKCSKKLPFDNLILDYPETNNKSGGDDDDLENSKNRRGRRSPPDKTPPINDPFSNPVGFWETTHVITPSNRFAHVKTSYKKYRIDTHSTTCFIPTDKPTPKTQTTSITSSSEAEGKPTNFVPSEDTVDSMEAENIQQSLNADFSLFIQICEQLESLENIKHLSSVDIFEAYKIDDTHIISEFPDSLTGLGESWIKIVTGKKPKVIEKRNRRFMIKRVISKRGHHYLLYVERKLQPPKQDKSNAEKFAIYLFSNPEARNINEETLISIIRDLSEGSFIEYKDTFSNIGLIVKAKLHRGSTLDIATRIKSEIDQW